MRSIIGTYENGCVRLDKDYHTISPVKVIVTFLENIEDNSNNRLTLSNFSFSKSRENLQDYKGSLANTVVDERRSAQ